MEFNAVILAGGRATRLGGVPKPGLKYDGETLLSHALQAARGASAVVVVGPDLPGPEHSGGPATTGQPCAGEEVSSSVLRAREEPVFAGPAAAIAAGLKALKENAKRSPWTLVLACDMPHASRGVGVLWAALESNPG